MQTVTITANQLEEGILDGVMLLGCPCCKTMVAVKPYSKDAHCSHCLTYFRVLNPYGGGSG